MSDDENGNSDVDTEIPMVSPVTPNYIARPPQALLHEAPTATQQARHRTPASHTQQNASAYSVPVQPKQPIQIYPPHPHMDPTMSNMGNQYTDSYYMKTANQAHGPYTNQWQMPHGSPYGMPHGMPYGVPYGMHQGMPQEIPHNMGYTPPHQQNIMPYPPQQVYMQTRQQTARVHKPRQRQPRQTSPMQQDTSSPLSYATPRVNAAGGDGNSNSPKGNPNSPEGNRNAAQPNTQDENPSSDTEDLREATQNPGDPNQSNGGPPDDSGDDESMLSMVQRCNSVLDSSSRSNS